MGICTSQEIDVKKTIPKRASNRNPLIFSFANQDRIARVAEITRRGDINRITLEKTLFTGQKIFSIDVDSSVRISVGDFVNTTLYEKTGMIESFRK